MSYTPTTDFLALLRNTGSGERVASVPGLDYVVSALARAGLVTLSVSQTAPTSNQSATAWFKPASSSWAGEGQLFLWNSAAGDYELATPALWGTLLGSGAYSFQSVAAASGAIVPGTSILAIQRAAPAATALILPNLQAHWLSGRTLKIVDWSTAVANHAVTLTTPDGSTIMQQASWELLSTAVQLSGVTLYPAPDLAGWIIAP